MTTYPQLRAVEVEIYTVLITHAMKPDPFATICCARSSQVLIELSRHAAQLNYGKQDPAIFMKWHSGALPGLFTNMV